MTSFYQFTESQWEDYVNDIRRKRPQLTPIHVVRVIVEQIEQEGYNKGVKDAKENIRRLICESTK